MPYCDLTLTLNCTSNSAVWYNEGRQFLLLLAFLVVFTEFMWFTGEGTTSKLVEVIIFRISVQIDLVTNATHSANFINFLSTHTPTALTPLTVDHRSSRYSANFCWGNPWILDFVWMLLDTNHPPQQPCGPTIHWHRSPSKTMPHCKCCSGAWPKVSHQNTAL